MFWKRGNLKNIKSWSLVTKLMLLYALSTIAIFAAICIFLYPTFIKATHSQYNIITTYESPQANEHVAKKSSAADKKTMLVQCYKEAITALLFASVAAIVMGYIIARNALNRINEFVEKIEIITADSLHERISPNDWPKELKMLANRFNMMLDRVQASFVQLSQFSSDIAHELRSPVNNLRIATEVALSKEHTKEEYQHILEAHLEEYQYLSTLIENLLFIARSEHGQIKVNKKTYNAREEISKMLDYFQAIASEKNIDMTCQGDAGLFVEQILFKRAINNLLSNSLRYSPDNGKIVIHIKYIDENLVQISVSDTGIGISQENLLKIFDRFYRVDSSRSAFSGGIGLGLAIVKSIVELHQGNISIESKLNIGTTVHLQLPTNIAS